MGIQLQPAIDLLATKRFGAAYTMDGVEAVKTTILKQEEIFKQQLRELHRVYKMQRMLMEELKNDMKRQSVNSKTLTTTTTTTQATPGLGYSFLAQNERDSAWERSGSCSGGDSETRIKAKRSTAGFDFDIIRPANQHKDASTSTGTIKPGSLRITGAIHAGMEEELCGLDLTLSIGGGSGSVKKKRLRELESSDARKLDQKSQELKMQPSISATMRSSAGTL